MSQKFYKIQHINTIPEYIGSVQNYISSESLSFEHSGNDSLVIVSSMHLIPEEKTRKINRILRPQNERFP